MDRHLNVNKIKYTNRCQKNTPYKTTATTATAETLKKRGSGKGTVGAYGRGKGIARAHGQRKGIARAYGQGKGTVRAHGQDKGKNRVKVMII